MPAAAVAAVAAVAAAGAVVEAEAVAMIEAEAAAGNSRSMRRVIPPCQDWPRAVERRREINLSPGHRQIVRCLYPYPQSLYRHRFIAAAVGIYRHCFIAAVVGRYLHRSTAVAVGLYSHRYTAVVDDLYRHRSTVVAVEEAVRAVASDMWYCRGMWHRGCRNGE